MRRYRCVPVLAGAAVLAVGSGAASVAAATATAWTVRPGGAITASAVGTTTLKDTTTKTVLKCVSSSMSGTLKSGSGLPGTGIGSITTATYNCSQPLGFLHLTSSGLPWHLNLVSYDAGTGVSRGTISHLEFVPTAPGCRAVVKGTSGNAADGVVAVTYTNKTGRLKTRPAGGNLHWYHVSGCFGLINNGDPAALSATYAVSPPQKITGP